KTAVSHGVGSGCLDEYQPVGISGCAGNIGSLTDGVKGGYRQRSVPLPYRMSGDCVSHKPRRNASGLRVTRTARCGRAVLRASTVAAVTVAIRLARATAARLLTLALSASLGAALTISLRTALTLPFTLRTTLTTTSTRSSGFTVEGVFKTFRL